MRSVIPVLVIFAAMLAGVESSLAQDAMDLNRAINEWARSRQFGLAPEVELHVAQEAKRAVTVVHRNNPNISIAALDKSVAKAVVLYLDRTEKLGRSPKIADLLEEAATSKINATASAIDSLNDYPILIIEVRPSAPADFVVAIDGHSYQAGLSLFRVLTGSKKVQVTRMGRPPCINTIQANNPQQSWGFEGEPP